MRRFPRPPPAPDGKSGRTRSGGNVQAFANLNGNWAALRALVQREEDYVTALAAEVAPAPVAQVPLLDGDVHDLDGVQTVADHLFGLGGAGHRPVNPGMLPSMAEGSRLQSSPHPGDPVESRAALPRDMSSTPPPWSGTSYAAENLQTQKEPAPIARSAPTMAGGSTRGRLRDD